MGTQSLYYTIMVVMLNWLFTTIHTNLFPKERFFWSSFSSKKLEILSTFQDPRWRHVDFVIRYLNFPILSFHPVSTSFSFLVRVKEFKINFTILPCSIGTTSGAKSLVTLALWAWATLGSIRSVTFYFNVIIFYLVTKVCAQSKQRI